MPEPRNDRLLRPTPARVVMPSGSPTWLREYVRSVETWTRDAQIAVQDLQERVKELENGTS
jgi:hypothetical protein